MWSAITRRELETCSFAPVSRAAALDEILEQVDLVIAVDALRLPRCVPAHAGVDRGFRQRAWCRIVPVECMNTRFQISM